MDPNFGLVPFLFKKKKKKRTKRQRKRKKKQKVFIMKKVGFFCL